MSSRNKIEYYNCSNDGTFHRINKQQPNVDDGIDSKRKISSTKTVTASTDTVTPDISQKKLRFSHFGEMDDKQDSTEGSPLSFETIRNNNRLFFSYDPRGVPVQNDLPKDYCPDCRCPLPYCSNIVMGKEVEEHVRFLTNDDRRGRCGHDLRYVAVEATVKKAFSHQINHRMLNNGIRYVEGFNPYQGHCIPKCMLATQKKIIEKMMKEEDTIGPALFAQYKNCIEEYNNPHTKKEVNEKDKVETDDDLPALKTRNSSEDEYDEVDEEKRTCVEQKADICSMFKRAKMEIKKHNKTK
jgi:hypothetical protein